MNSEHFGRLLASLSGHLITRSPQEERQIQALNRSISRSLLHEDIQQLKGSRFAFEEADLFSPEQMPSERSDALRSITESKSIETAEPEFRVFAREVPVRSTQLDVSVPLWAGGAAVDHTLGPFANKDGRLFWFDFFRIEKLVALYVQGKPNPVLLFKVRTGLNFIAANLPLVTDPNTSYRLPAGSIWIYSQVLAQNSPSGFYTGLTIKGGTVELSAGPQLINGKLTIAPTTVVTVRLQLQQPVVTDADTTSPYGIDARAAELQLPQQFSFHFSSLGTTIDEASSARWKVYGHQASFQRKLQSQPDYDGVLHRVLIPFNCSTPTFEVTDSQSQFHTLNGEAPITSCGWALASAPIDIVNPTPAAGIGAMLVKCSKGLTNTWKGLKGGDFNLNQPSLMAEPGRIAITDLTAGNKFSQQTFDLWKDEQNPFGTSVQLQYPSATLFLYNSFANGNEALLALANADVQIDRPVTVAAEALAIRSQNSLVLLAANKTQRVIYLFDDNILFDSTDLKKKPPIIPRPIALALHNALFKVTPVNGCALFGQLAEDFVRVKEGFLFLTFGMYAYLPTLPDPYAANLGALRFQFRGMRSDLASTTMFGGQSIWLWLVSQVKWKAAQPDNDSVEVSFHFAPLQNQFQLMQDPVSEAGPETAASRRGLCESVLTPLKPEHEDQVAATPAPGVNIEHPGADANLAHAMLLQHEPDYQDIWDDQTRCLQQDLFALLDVSTNADLLGVSFDVFGVRRVDMVRTLVPTTAFPLQVQGMDVVSRGNNVRAFTVPQISWEPVLNTAPKVVSGDPPGHPKNQPPFIVPNYYPNDGGPTRIYNNSINLVPVSPIPLSQFIVDEYKKNKLNITSSLFTLPFGMRALAVLNKFIYPQEPPSIRFTRPVFENDLNGGLQIRFKAGKLPTDDFPMFNGGTLQINNVLDFNGSPSGAGTLGQSVGFIFNEEFKPKISPNILISRGVPLTRVDFSGYGASIFSNWFNPLAQMAQTSQSKFDVWVGRTAHEVIQVKSIIYPWGIRVVRTIILYRASTGYVYRVDTGWKAESDGQFDFSYYIKDAGKLKAQFPDYQVHPGVIKGLFNIKNIVEEDNQFPTKTFVHNGEYYLDENNFVLKNTSGSNIAMDALLQMVFFDADVEIENVIQGHVSGRVPSKRIMGFVQLAPRGIPLSKEALLALLSYQPIPIGGPVDCLVNIGKSGQQMRVNRFDVNNSFAANGTDPTFVAAARGNVLLPKDGSWSMVTHQRGTGEVTPLPAQLSVPLIRIGELKYSVVTVDTNTERAVIQLSGNPDNQLLRIANPTELLRQPVDQTGNYGFLHSTDTQKALFLTPSYRQGLDRMLSKTPPLFVDAFRIVNSKAVFPNIGDGSGNFGDAISLVKSGAEFAQNALADAGKQVLELMQIDKVVGGVKEEGYKLLKKVEEFDLPNTEWKLIEIGGAFKIYIEYKADKVQKPGGAGTKNLKGSLNFDVDSFANLEDRWKSRMANVALVVDLGPIKRLMTIKGNWDAKKGAEAQYKGSDTDPDFPSPQIEFAPELEPVIEILQILQDLQGENYKDAFRRGLKLAMSNKAGTWEYKLEASKEIPVVRFPMPAFLYNDPNAPFKLEAGLKLGAYFNAALKVTTDPNQLLPTAGGFLGFYGRLSVMCVSLSIATVYAVGQVNLDIGADTKVGPSLRMKFGFGAQLVIGLPVVGNVSVLYMVGVEIYVDSVKVNVSAFLLFQGHAELLAGLVSITITIEAKGTISRANDRTDLAAQVNFAIDITIFWVIDINFSTSWQEQRQIA